MNYKSYTMDLAGKPLTLEFGKYCEQAAGSVWVHLGDTVVMGLSSVFFARGERYCGGQEGRGALIAVHQVRRRSDRQPGHTVLKRCVSL